MGYRQQRVADQIRRELADLIQYHVKDPGLGLVTVTEVRMSGDLRYARVWVSVYGDDEQERASLERLRHAAGFLRREVAHRVRLREAPELRFVADRTLKDAERLERLLRDAPGTRAADGDGEGEA